MNNLRTALEELAAEYETYPVGTISTAAVERHLRHILAAHPTDTETEWGVENGHNPIDIVDPATDKGSAEFATRGRQKFGIPARIVSRTVTPWQVSK